MPNRYICDVFGEMRECLKTLNFSYIAGLIEEAQVLANRMEASLYDKKEEEYAKEKVRNLKKEKKSLRKEIEELVEKKEKLEETVETLELKQGFVKKTRKMPAKG